MRVGWTAAALLGALILAGPAPARGQAAVPKSDPAVEAKAFEADAPGFELSADLSYVLTSGNSRTGSLGFGAALKRRWSRQGLALSAAGTRASSSSGLNFARGSASSFEVVGPDPEPTVEYYKLRGRYDYRFASHVFALGGGGWERNRFSGLRSRFVAEAGLGYVFVASEATDFRSTLGATYTNNQEVVRNPELQDNFAGARLSWTLRQRLSATAQLVHDLVLDENLSQTDDFRADLSLALSVAVSSRLALQASYRLLYRKLPALEQLPLQDAAGNPLGSVAAPLREVDQGLSVSLLFRLARAGAGS